MDSTTTTPRITSNRDSDVTPVASYGENNGDLEYTKSPKNLPTSLANTLELEVCIHELQQMHEVSKNELDTKTQPTELFTQPYKLDTTYLTSDGTILAETHRDNGASPPHSTQPSSSHSPLTDASVDMNEYLLPPPH